MIFSNVVLAGLLGCSAEEQRSIDPVQVGMTAELAAIYDDGELTLFEVKSSLPLPILAPDEGVLRALAQISVEPFERAPWVTTDDVDVQITWTLSNLDAQNHAVEILIDPWNEFGRYWPGLALVDPEDEEFQPNLSGIDILYELPGTADGRPSRLHGTYTFDDMRELAIDFATVINIIENPPEDPDDGSGMEFGEAAVNMVNHAFAVENRSFNDPFVARYIPSVIPALTGIDFGLRTREPANIALELVVEVVDHQGERVAEEGSNDPLLDTVEEYFTVGTAP